jgi:hypothetical protein
VILMAINNPQYTIPNLSNSYINSSGSLQFNNMNFTGSTPVTFNGPCYINSCRFDDCDITIRGQATILNSYITNGKGAGAAINIKSPDFPEKKYELYDWIRLQIGTIAEEKRWLV